MGRIQAVQGIEAEPLGLRVPHHLIWLLLDLHLSSGGIEPQGRQLLRGAILIDLHVDGLGLFFEQVDVCVLVHGDL